MDMKYADYPEGTENSPNAPWNERERQPILVPVKAYINMSKLFFIKTKAVYEDELLDEDLLLEDFKEQFSLKELKDWDIKDLSVDYEKDY
jgi:hypothetical protein